MSLARLKYPVAVAGAALLLGLMTDLLLNGQPLGISVPIIFTAVVLVMLGLTLIEDRPITLTNTWIIAPMLFAALMSAVRAAPMLRFLNITGAFLILLVLANRLSTSAITGLTALDYSWALVESSLMSLILSVPLIGRAIAVLRHREQSTNGTTQRVLIGLLIAAPFLLIFTVLFASADLVFGHALNNLLDSIHLGDIIGHTLLTLIFSLLIAGGLVYTLTRSANPAPTESAEGTDPPKPLDIPGKEGINSAALTLRGKLGIIESSVVLFSVDVLFLIFVTIQFAALFGGEAFLRSQGLTYSEYARRGFFELLAVAIITFSLILALEFLTGRESSTHRNLFLVSSGLMTITTIIILASAFQRMRLYEWAYGFTEMRVYPHVFMIWLALLIGAFFVLLLANRTRQFATILMIVMMGFVTTLDILNPDAFIVRENLARTTVSDQRLDVDYLGSLSADGIRYLVPLLDSSDPEIRDRVGPWLRLQLIRLDERERIAGWPAYHLSINRAFQMLQARRQQIEKYEPIFLYDRD